MVFPLFRLQTALPFSHHTSITFDSDVSVKSTNFYLNRILASGATSPDLIDSVTLSSATNNKAYISLDYDLKVALDSAQVTYDADGNVTADALATSAWTYAPDLTNEPTLTWQ